MQTDRRFYIYERKEMIILIMLGAMVATFAFTLGVHLGKNVNSHPVASESHDVTLAKTERDTMPNRQELIEQTKGSQNAAEITLNESLHDEVARSGLKLDVPRQVVLPTDPKAQTGGRTTLNPLSAEERSVGALSRETPKGSYTIQTGSFPNLSLAKKKAELIEALGLQPFMRYVDLGKKGKWYRVYVGGFDSVADAESAGKRYKDEGVVTSFIVAKMPQR